MRKRLTAADVSAAKAKPGERLELWDERCPGLCLRVTDRGVKTWVFRYRTLDGRQPRMTLGTARELDLADARDKADEIRKAAREGRDPSGERKKAAAEARSVKLRTMGDLWDAYLAAVESGEFRPGKRKAPKKASTIAGERGLWERHLKPRMGDDRLDDVSRAGLRAVLRAIKAKAPIQSNRCLALLRVMFGFAVREERLAVNPALGIEPLAVERKKDRILSDAELKAVWRGLANPSALSVERKGQAEPVTIGRPVCIALRLALLTLQRRANVAKMRVADLRLDEGGWLIGGSEMKRDAAHFVPLTDYAVQLIRDALALRSGDSPYVFPSPRSLAKPIGEGALSHAAGDLLEGLGIEGATLHDFRRTGSTVMVSERLRVAPYIVSRVLSHAAQDTGGAAAVTLAHYIVYDFAAEKRAALAGWEGLLLEIVGERKRPSNVARLESAGRPA